MAGLQKLSGAAEASLSMVSPETTVAALTTLVLALGVRRIGAIREVTPALIRELTVQDREYLLRALRARNFGTTMWIQLACPREDCGEPMEMPLKLDALPIEKRPLASRSFVVNLPPAVEFRLPCGGDVEEAAGAALGDDCAVRDFFLARCLKRVGSRPTRGAVPASLPDAARAAIEERMEDLSPAVTPELEGQCPSCQREFSAMIDLTDAILHEFLERARRLERDVHQLAWHYHWAEADILAMPREKRLRYLKLIEDQNDYGGAGVWG